MQNHHTVSLDCFVEVCVHMPLDVRDARQVRGIDTGACRGKLTGFTGVDDPYGAPLNPSTVLDTIPRNPEQNVRLIVDYLAREGLVREVRSGERPQGSGNGWET